MKKWRKWWERKKRIKEKKIKESGEVRKELTSIIADILRQGEGELKLSTQ